MHTPRQSLLSWKVLLTHIQSRKWKLFPASYRFANKDQEKLSPLKIILLCEMWLLSCFLFKKCVHVLMLLATSLICQMFMKTEKRAKLFRHIQCWKIYNSIFWNVVLVVCLLCWALLKTFLFAKKYCYAGGTFAHQVYSLNIIIGRKVLLACGKPTSCSSSHSKSLWPPQSSCSLPTF